MNSCDNPIREVMTARPAQFEVFEAATHSRSALFRLRNIRKLLS
jgi:hypothetical protein